MITQRDEEDKEPEWAMKVLIIGVEEVVRIAHDLYRLGYDICVYGLRKTRVTPRSLPTGIRCWGR
ncbi:MAG: hypothetical protein ACLR6J_14830 [Parabacteroides merdae]